MLVFVYVLYHLYMQDRRVYNQYSFYLECWKGPQRQHMLLHVSDDYCLIFYGYTNQSLGSEVKLAPNKIDHINARQSTSPTHEYLGKETADEIYQTCIKNKKSHSLLQYFDVVINN